MNAFCVVTTVNKPTRAIQILYDKFGSNLIVVGDEKTPKYWNYKGSKYILDLPDENLWYQGYAPRNSYARKNLGYLEAMRKGASVIYESDDDTSPNSKWMIRDKTVNGNVLYDDKWCNVYKFFGNENIWPRGLSLSNIRNKSLLALQNSEISSIHQGMIDGDPDIDAICRMMYPDKHYFKKEIEIYLPINVWCPFNSQNTLWFKDAFALMYLPVTATMRMTDIWRSFVGQRCLWELGQFVSFHSPSDVFQDRNEHDLLKDFKDEIPGYLHNDEIVETLSGLKLKQGQEYVCENMLTCYQAIVDKGILPEMEIRSLKQWIKDYEAIK